MKIYNNQNPLGIDSNTLSQLKIPLLIIAVVLVFVWLLSGGAQNVLNANLEKNPLQLSTNDSTLLRVIVTNPTSHTLTNLVVSTKTLGSTQLSVYPTTQTIQLLGPQEERKLEFLVAPIDTSTNPFLPGTYRIDITTSFDSTDYQTSVFVNVEK